VLVRILVAEDDTALLQVLARGLKEEGYVVDTAAAGDDALAMLRTNEYAAAILDWRMPQLQGVDVVAEARHLGIAVPVLMLTAKDTPLDRIAGLDAGADDYLVKPFHFGELLARLRALQRRTPVSSEPILRCGNLVLDRAARGALVSGRVVSLTPTEYGILELLLRRTSHTVDRRAIEHHVWPEEGSEIISNTLDVHIARLRAKIRGSGATIRTVRATGFRLEPAA
jgi:DNA-binding response OmpR family regulator